MNFSEDQQKAIDIRNKNVVVSASAGSGKTAVLVERLCKLVTKDKISIDSILAMTFTNDAAAEMKVRLKQALQQIKNTQPNNEYINQQLLFLETASICTIDSFCQKIVKDFYYKIPITYTMAQTVGNTSELQSTFQNAYINAFNQLSTNEAYKLSLFFKLYGKGQEDIKHTIESIINISNAKPNENKWFDTIVEMYSKWDSLNISYFLKYFIDRIYAMTDILEYMIDQINYIEFKKEKDFDKYLNLFQSKKEKLNDCLPYLQDNNYSMFRAAFIIYLNSTDNMPGTICGNDFKSIKSEYLKFQEAISDILFEFEVYEEDLKNNKELIEILIKLCKNTKLQFSIEKKELEIIDFNDMEHFALKLLDDVSIQEELRNKYKMILIDEFQDTNELQETIISKFCRTNNVFRVGDIKQSIYGFRQANPNIMKNHMNRENEFNETLVLKENYRSNKSIIDFNNDFYQKIMNTKLLGSQFNNIDIAYVGTSKQSTDKQYPIRFIYTEQDRWRKNQEEKINAQKVKSMHEKNRYSIIANDILEHIKNGRKYKDICILLRSKTKQEELKKCLESYHIPVYASISNGFFLNNSVQIVLSCLNALRNPNDDIHLIATLHSPLFDISMDTISTACMEKNKSCSIYQYIKNQDFMKSFIQMRNDMNNSIVNCLKTIYEHNNFYQYHTSSQDKTNLDFLLEKAIGYDSLNNLSRFINDLEKESKLDKIGEAASFGKEEDVVKIMTMHGSKGLQFPVVYILSKSNDSSRFEHNPVLIDSDLGISLASLDHKQKNKRTSIYQIAYKTKKLRDDLMEEMRVLYVATTRAKEELIFVDTISSDEQYNYPLNTRALLNKHSYTSWIFHTYKNSSNSFVQFEKMNNLYDKLEPSIEDTKFDIPIYSKSFESLASQTASSKKSKTEWVPFQKEINNSARRGTLFHEIVANCSYPYKEEEIKEYAKKKEYKLCKTDLNQILALNYCKEYKLCMKHKHQFELSYIVKDKGAILHGFMDMVTWLDDKVIILDFKTDTISNPDELIQKYKKQLEIYRDAYKKIDNSKSIEIALYSFHLNKYKFV